MSLRRLARFAVSEIPDDADVVKREPCPVCGTLVDVFHEFTGLIPIEVDGDEANHTKTVCALRVQLKSAAFLIETALMAGLLLPQRP